jgi:hypothetical protein
MHSSNLKIHWLKYVNYKKKVHVLRIDSHKCNMLSFARPYVYRDDTTNIQQQSDKATKNEYPESTKGCWPE